MSQSAPAMWPLTHQADVNCMYNSNNTYPTFLCKYLFYIFLSNDNISNKLFKTIILRENNSKNVRSDKIILLEILINLFGILPVHKNFICMSYKNIQKFSIFTFLINFYV